MSKVIYEGWMVRYGRRKIRRSFIHMRYFVLETRVLAYYKRKPQDNQVPIKTLLIDGSCRVEDRGLKMHHGHMVYVLCVYNKKEKHHRVTMAAFNIQEALIWKEKIELVIDQQQGSLTANGNKVYASFQYKSGIENGRKSSSSDQESQCSPEDEEESQRTLLRRTTIGNGLPESVLDWTREHDSGIADQSASDQVFSRKHWCLVRCQNGLRIFEELVEVDYLPRSCSRAMKAVGVVEASCEAVFELVMGMDGTRFEWDCSFQYGSLVEEVDGHTAILYHRLQLDWFSIFVWPRDLCYVRYWRRNDDGSYVVLFRSRDHPSCGPQPGFVRAHIESGGFNISPLKSRNGRPRTQVEHLMQIDLKGWGVGYVPSFQQHCLLQMLNTVAGLREWFSQTDESNTVPRLPVMANMTTASVSSKKEMKTQETSIRPTPSLDQLHLASRNSVMLDEDSDEDDDYQIPEPEQEGYSVKLGNDIKRIAINVESSDQIGVKRTALNEEPSDQFDLSCFSGNLRRDDRDKTRDCWRISDASNFRVRSKHFAYDKTKIPAGKPLMELVAVDWFKDVKRMDHVAGRQGCAVQLDENSRLVLKKLVDGATNQALQSQAKIVCNKPSPKPEIKEAKIPTDKEADSSEKFQKCNLVAANQVLNTGKEQAANEANPSQAEKQLDLKNSGQIPNLAFNRGRDLTLARQNSLKSTTSHRHHHHHRELKPREPKVRTNNSATKAIGIIQDQRVSTKPVPNYDLFAIVPAEKRARIEKITTGSLALPPPISSIPRTRIVGRADRDLTHSKRHEPGLNTLTLFTGAPSSKPLSRMGSLKVKDIGRNKCGDGPSKALSRMASLEGKDRGRNRSGDKPSKPPSRTGSFKWKDRGRNSSVEGSAGSNKPGSLNGKDRGRNSSVEGSVGSNKPEKRRNQEPNKYNRRPTVVGARPPRILATLKSVGYESMSEPTSDSTGSSSVSRRSRRVVPSRRKQQPGGVEEKPPSKILTSQRTVRPTRPKKQPTPPRPTEKRREGQLKRFKNKLAIIFHHHHHHHIHDGHMDTVVKHGGTHVTNEKHHRSPWMYLRSLLHHTSGQDPGRNNSKKLAKASGRAVGQQQHGYFYALLEGLVRHVWGMSRQKKARARHNQLGKAGSRRGSKRLQYWWQRFRRRRGLKLGNKKMPRFRLGFKRSHSGTNRNRA